VHACDSSSGASCKTK